MYETWESLLANINAKFRNYDDTFQVSVLNAYPPDVGKEVAQKVVKYLAEPDLKKDHFDIQTEKQVSWTMDVLCYSLQLAYVTNSADSNLTADDTVKKGYNVYYRWLDIMLPNSQSNTNKFIPNVVKADPNFYCQLILKHLFNMFVPRRDPVSPSSATSLPPNNKLHVDNVDDWNKYQLIVCNNFLKKCKEIARESTCISFETWETLLEFLLIVNHVVLSVPKDSQESIMSRQLSLEEGKKASKGSLHTSKDTPIEDYWSELCKQVIDALFYIWLLACQKHFPRPSLWKTFSELILHWRHHEEVTVKWGAAVQELTTSMLGKRSNREPMLLPLDMSDETVKQTWFRMLHLLGNPIDLAKPVLIGKFMFTTNNEVPAFCVKNMPNIFYKAVVVISKVADQFLSSKPRSTGNSILHLLGHWLFEIANVQTVNYEMGRANACGCLCNIFSKSRPDFLPVYLSRFYVAIFQGLEIVDAQEHNLLVVATIVYKSTNLLSLGLKGIHVLLPRFFTAVKKILQDGARFKIYLPEVGVTVVDLQRAAIRLLLTIISLPNHFSSTPLVPLLDRNSPSVTYLSLRTDIVSLILDVLASISDSVCIQMLLCGLLTLAEDVASYEALNVPAETPEDPPPSVQAPRSTSNLMPKETGSNRNSKENRLSILKLKSLVKIDTTAKLFQHAIAVICKRLTLVQESPLRMDSETTLVALEVLGGFAKLPAQTSLPSQNIVKSCIRWLCDFIAAQCERPKQEHIRNLHSQIVYTYSCLSQWALSYPRLLQNEDTLLCLLEIIELGLSGSKSSVFVKGAASPKVDPKQLKSRSPHSNRLAQAAECLLSLLMSHVGAFPPPMGSQTAHSGLLTESHFDGYCPRYLALHKSMILAILEPTFSSRAHALPNSVVILRSAFGRHVWHFELRDVPRTPAGAPLHHPRRPPPNPALRPPWELTCNLAAPPNFPEESGDRTPVLADLAVPQLAAVTPNSDDMLQLLSKAKLPQPIRPGSENNPAAVECRPPCPVTDFQPARLFLLHLGFLDRDSSYALDASTQDFFDHLAELDTLPVRSVLSVSLVYYPLEKAPSVEFTTLFKGFGWVPGNLPTVVYWADAISEVLFHRPKPDAVPPGPCIVWLEDPEQLHTFPHDKVCPSANPIIFLTCRSRLVRVLHVAASIRTIATQQLLPPVLPGLVLPLRTAPCLLRQALLNWAARMRLCALPSHGKSSLGGSEPAGEPFPHVIRQRKIQEIIRGSEDDKDALLLMLLRQPDCGPLTS